MAENETLDLRRSPRWRQARRLLENGASPAEIAQEMLHPLSAMLKRVAQLIPIGQLIKEALAPDGDPNALRSECRDAADHAAAIILLARSHRTEAQLLESFCLHVATEFFDQERQALSFSAQGMSPEQLGQTKVTTLHILTHHLPDFVRGYVVGIHNETRSPAPRVPKPSQHELLGTSLL